MTTRLDTDVLIVGAGLAALSTALAVTGRRVTLLHPDPPLEATASARAQGGVAAATARDDDWVQHYLDTLRVGDHAVSAWAALTLTREARAAVEFLGAQGVRFDRTDEGWALSREAGHSRARVLRVGGDRTGAALVQALLEALAARSGLERIGNVSAMQLLLSHEGVEGIAGADAAGRCIVVRARDTVLATGGLGYLFRRTTNPPGACGDGLAMALAAGARCAALEFVQFHPTALAVAADPLPLVTEALRGAGALLVNDRGGRFMREVHRDAELAPRDVVARAIWAQLHAGRTVYLDATRAPGAQIATCFPTVHALCRRYGIDPRSTPIPITPAAHFHMGGIVVDPAGHTSLPHLWACGETAFTGAHGANRLASNSLLEAVVFGRRAGAALSRAALRRGRGAPVDAPAEPAPPATHAGVSAALRAALWQHLGIVRTAEGLEQGLRTIAALARAARSQPGILGPRLVLAREMLRAALRRTESRGAHHRADYPHRRAAWDGPIAAPGARRSAAVAEAAADRPAA